MSTDAKTPEDTPSKNTRLAKKQALIKDTTTTPSANEDEAAATKTLATPKSAKKKSKKKKEKKMVEEKEEIVEEEEKKKEGTTETAMVTANSGSDPVAEAVRAVTLMAQKSAEKGDENGKALAKRQTKLEKDQSKLKKDQSQLARKVNRNHQWTKKKFDAQDEEIAALRKDQEETQSDLACLRTVIVALLNSTQQNFAVIKHSIESLFGSLFRMGSLLDARTRSDRNFASTAAFFAIVLAIVLGYYLLATTFLAITLGFYFLNNLYKK